MEAAPPLPRGGERFGAWFDHKAADAACAFFAQHLRLTLAEWAGQPFVLPDWQRAIVRAVFGWKRADGTRLIRTVYIEVPRKNGKTELAAGLALLILLGDAEMGGEVYSMAVDQDQATIVFKRATTMVQFSETLRKEIETLKTAIYVPTLMASFKPFSSAAASKHGFAPSGSVSDEIHEWPNGELFQVVHDGEASRRQPLDVLITTAGLRNQGFGWEMHDRAIKVRDGTLVDPTFLAVIYAAEDGDDWKDEETWRKANPGYGASVKPAFIREAYERALESPRLENNFKRFHLNIWTEQVTRWLPMERWDACPDDIGWRDLAQAMRGRRCYVGLDLSSTTDITALVYVFPPASSDPCVTLVPRFFVPGENVEMRVKRDRVPYDDWIRAGALCATEGNVVDYRAVRAALAEDAGLFVIEEVGYDPWNSQQLVTELMDEGLPMTKVIQGMATLSGPTKAFEALVIGKTLRHGNHPVLRYMARSVAVSEDAAGNIKPAKDKSNTRIDGIAAAITGLSRMIAAPAEPARSFWDSPRARAVA